MTHVRRRALGAIAVLVVLVGGLALFRANSSPVTSAGTRSSVAPTSASGSATPPAGSGAGTYKVVGNTILGPSGAPYIPGGITIYGLAEKTWQGAAASDDAEIRATATAWHGNTVRLQVSPRNLLDAQPYDQAFMSEIKNQVTLAEGLGLNVIISAQYERTGKLPTADSSTLAFWKIIAPIYKGDARIWFDLFNEPTVTWSVWQNGGNGAVGMQSLVDAVRGVGAHNLVLAEGINGARTLNGMPLLAGENIVYEVHPYGEFSAAARDSNWGNRTAQIPILVGEWGVWQASQSCHASIPTLVPEFLTYLAAHHVGLIAYSLDPGNLIRGTDLTSPTRFDPGVVYQCGSVDTGPTAQGDGADVTGYLQQYASH